MSSKNYKGLWIAGLLVLATGSLIAQQQETTAKVRVDQVIVTNPSSQPVPVIHQGPVSVGGAVSISNLPAVQQIAGAVTITRPALQHGNFTIRLSAVFTERAIAFPEDVVVTDLRLERVAFSGDDASCEVWLYETANGSFGPVTTLRPSATNPFVELHLESGFGPQAGVTDRGMFMNSACTVRVFWTGYTAQQ